MSQAPGIIHVSGVLSNEDVVALSVEGDEAISELFQYRLTVESAKPDIQFEQVVGKAITVNVKSSQDGKTDKFINGLVSAVEAGDFLGGNRTYVLSIRPAFALAEMRSNCKIFQNLSAKDIIDEILSEYSVVDFVWKLNASPASREYCVQYNESDYNFILRLLEEEGIAYYFAFSDSAEQLVFCNSNSEFEVSEQKEIEYSQGTSSHNQINYWQRKHQWQTCKRTLRDYDPQKPKIKLESESTSDASFANSQLLERYEYPGKFDENAAGNAIALSDITVTDSANNLVEARSNYVSLSHGQIFTLSRHEVKAEQGEFIITSLNFFASDVSFKTDGGTAVIQNTFNCVSKDTPYLPRNRAHKPRIDGVQTALVVGPSAEEIHTKEGCIKVQFHWDRLGQKDEESSCWIRVAQIWADKNWGAQFIPRIGQEVVVQFLNGDPDRPLVTGTVYNGENPIPYSDKTQSGVKTRSSKGASSGNYNELRFEDLKGSEKVSVRAEKDFHRYVVNDELVEIDNLQTIKVKNNRTISVDEGDESKSVVQGKQEITINKDRKIVVQQGDLSEAINQGNHSIKIDAGKSEVTAQQSIELKVGSNSIKIDQSGITIKGIQVVVEGSAKVDVKAGGITTIKGALVKIN